HQAINGHRTSDATRREKHKAAKADAMRRTKARLSLPSLSFVHNWERRRLTNGSSNRLDSFRKYSPLRVGAKQEVLAVGDPVSGSGAAEPLSNHRRGHRRADGEANSR